MIFRVFVLLPAALSIPAGSILDPIEYRTGRLRTVLHGPVRAAVHQEAFGPFPSMPIRAALESIKPADEQQADPRLLVDGAPTLQADLLRIEFHRQRFRRSRATMAGIPSIHEGDPSAVTIAAAANRWIETFRTLGRAAPLHPLVPGLIAWRGRYLHDDGTELRADRRLLRGRSGIGDQWSATALTQADWDTTRGLVATFKPPVWESLALDASDLLPAVAPSIAIAFTALESFLDDALGRFPRARRLPKGYWSWVTSRRKAPDPEEALDGLLAAMTGQSLKLAAPALWNEFKNLERARNTLVHSGTARTTDGVVVDSNRAIQLVACASQVIDWVEALLPATERLPRSGAVHHFTFVRPIVSTPAR